MPAICRIWRRRDTSSTQRHGDGSWQESGGGYDHKDDFLSGGTAGRAETAHGSKASGFYRQEKRWQPYNEQNEILLNQALEMVEFDLTLLKSMRQAPETANYNKNACNTGDLLRQQWL